MTLRNALLALALAGLFLALVLAAAAYRKNEPQMTQSSTTVEASTYDNTTVAPEASADPAVQATVPAVEQKETNNNITAGGQYSGKLTDDGSINVLIIGQDKSNGLYDTIGIASIDRKAKKLKIIMIPRDTYIEYNPDILDMLQKSGKINSPGIFKINCSHLIGNMLKYKGKFNPSSISFLAEVIKEKFGVDVDDYIKINTEGFDEIVDLLGGVDIKVPYNMNYDDPTQDLHIHLEKGMQHLDGIQAEGFVRFRKGYREDGSLFEIGDIGRKNNQINLLKAMIDQHGTVGNVEKIPKILSILGKNVQHSIGLGELLQKYLGIAKDIVTDKYTINSENLDGSAKNIGGASYVVIN